jgi:hypothetical protein
MSDGEVLEPEPDESDGEAIDPAPSFLAEARSILISAVGVTFQRFIVIDDEVELASWRRFRRTIVTGAILIILMDRGLDLAFRLHVGTSPEDFLGLNYLMSVMSGLSYRELSTLSVDVDIREILALFIWQLLTILPIALLIGFSATYFLEKFLSQDERSSDLATLAQPIAIVWVQRLVFAGLFITLSDIFVRWWALGFATNSTPEEQLLFGSDTAEWLYILTAAIGIGLIIYSYFLFKRTLTRLYADLRGYELWIALGILAFHFEILFYVATRGVIESPLGGLYWRIAQYIINL